MQRQLEFYFSDANLVSDNFMKVEMAKNKDGSIPLSIFLTFKRIEKLTADIDGEESKIKALADALKDSSSLECDGETVKRKDPFDLEAASNGRDDRTLVVKGFPVTASLDDIIAFFDSKVEGVAAVRKWMRSERCQEEKSFTGQVWVELTKAELTEDAVKAINELTFDGDNALEATQKKAFIRKPKKGKTSVFEVIPELQDGQELKVEPLVFAIRREFGKFNESVQAVQVVDKKFLVKLGGSIPARLSGKYVNKEFKLTTGFDDNKEVYQCTLQIVEEQEVENTFVDGNKLVKFELSATDVLPTAKQLRTFFDGLTSVKFVDYTDGAGYIRLQEPVAAKFVADNKAAEIEYIPLGVSTNQEVMPETADSKSEVVDAKPEVLDAKTETSENKPEEPKKVKVAFTMEAVTGDAEKQYWNEQVYRLNQSSGKRGRDNNSHGKRNQRQRTGR